MEQSFKSIRFTHWNKNIRFMFEKTEKKSKLSLKFFEDCRQMCKSKRNQGTMQAQKNVVSFFQYRYKGFWAAVHDFLEVLQSEQGHLRKWSGKLHEAREYNWVWGGGRLLERLGRKAQSARSVKSRTNKKQPKLRLFLNTSQKHRK